MTIKDLQRRQTEVGRIRIGETKDTGRKNKHGDPIMRPVKLEKFRFTSPSKTLIEQVAGIYGGAPAEWHPQGGGAMQWEVYTDAESLPVVVPPNSVSQWYETWAGGACTRRCDGEREMLKDQPCQCSPDPGERACKPTTRISLMLAEVPGIGVWRLESHGYYAATELPAVAELLAAAGGYVAGRLELEERSARREKADGSGMETRRWMVPVLHVDAPPAQLLALTGGGGQAAIEAPQSPTIDDTADPLAEYLAQIEAATDVEGLRALWRHIGETAELTREQTAALTQAFWARKKVLDDRVSTEPSQRATDPQTDGGPDMEAMWAEVLALAGERDWNMAAVGERFQAWAGWDYRDDERCDGRLYAAFRDAIKTGDIR